MRTATPTKKRRRIVRKKKAASKKKAACKPNRRKAPKSKSCPKPKPVRRRPKPVKRKPKAPLKNAPPWRPVAVQPVPPVPGTTVTPPAQAPASPQAPAAPEPAAPEIPPPAPGPDSPGTPDPEGPADSPLPVYDGPFGVREAERLLWRAGCGPSPGHAEALAEMGLEQAVLTLTRPAGEATLTGAEPTDGRRPLYPSDGSGHDYLWFLDRMVRTDQPLVERMTLIWHDWFATSGAVVDQGMMIAQNELFRAGGLGSFHELVRDVTRDPAMILWLNLRENRRGRPNENYARELMELFTLGADRGAYSEDDVRELALCLTGWAYQSNGDGTFRGVYMPDRHETGTKTVFGKTGSFDWADAVRMCIEHDKHATFFVRKLWSYFIPTEPSEADLEALAEQYVRDGHQIRPVVEAILLHPDLHAGPRMVKSPAVYLAGMMRIQRCAVDRSDWVQLSEGMGQRLFYPPNVAGWNDQRWLDSSTLRARWLTCAELLEGRQVQGTEASLYDPDETPEQAVDRALDFWENPPLTDGGRAQLEQFASSCLPTLMTALQQRQYRAMRQNALRLLVAVSPDLQTC